MSRKVATFNPVKLEPWIDPQNARTLALQPLPNLTVARGTLLGQVTTAGGTFGMVGPYASANTDGTQIPIGPSEYDFVTDAGSNAVLGPTGSTTDLLRGTSATVPVFWKGTWLESHLVGLDANAVTVMKAREIGVGTAKMLHLG